jgi:hypothetical protein
MATAEMPGRALMQGETVTAGAPRQEEGNAVLTMPDGTRIEFPVLLDSAGAKFIDIRKLQPT